MKQITLFGVRHLSPAGAWHLQRLLEEKKPKLVLVEGPSDFTPLLHDLARKETRPPVAVLAYTKDAPVRTLLYPMADYSPEYQAILWAHNNKAKCRFIDLSSDIFLALAAQEKSATDGEEQRMDVYRALDQQAGEDGHETFWERTLEHTMVEGAYQAGACTFGTELRNLTAGQEEDWAENLVRESYMRRQIEAALAEGYKEREIVVVTGSYHVEGLQRAVSMRDEELALLPRLESNQTLMPYSYYRLSSRYGYGAGNKAPAYYELLWDSLCKADLHRATRSYLSRIAHWQRAHGFPVSSAAVIEAVRLSTALAAMRGSSVPALRDLRDAAITCLGNGSFSEISGAVANTEVGTAIGALPDGVSRTSIQEDFYRQLKTLKLEKYRSMTTQELPLDLREDRAAKNKQTAFLDLERSFFLHRLSILGISFAHRLTGKQDSATWAEPWAFQWTPEAEIELVESALKGDTVLLATSFVLKERVEQAGSIAAIAAVIEDAFTCGMPSAVAYATDALQAMAVDAVAFDALAETAARLSHVVQYGNIRRLDSTPLEPLLQQLYLRGCLLLAESCVCDDQGAAAVIGGANQLNAAALAHDFLEDTPWISALREIAHRDDLNTRCSGFGAAILLERGQLSTEELSLEVQRRLSKGVPADLGAGWFEGLALKNRYSLIARLSLWESLDAYLAALDDEEFKRALVFLRRAFADFSPREKSDIAENLGELWQLNPQQVSEAVNTPLPPEAAQSLADDLDGFDFDDI